MTLPRGMSWLGALLGLGLAAQAEVHLRWNRAGYAPERPKVVLAMSDEDLRGRPWSVSRTDAGEAAEPVLRGTFGASVAGAEPHTPLGFNHPADLGALRVPGMYVLTVAGAPAATVRVAADPYAALRELPLQHLRFARSGSHEARLRSYSHPGDARAPVAVPDGDPANGRWKRAEPARTVDVAGGWYDAGDQIKFTLNQAYTAYHLLLAYRLEPGRWSAHWSRSGLPDVLDEARHGLEFLMKVHPDPDTFVIQVADATDHNQPARLPEHDGLDGRRPALCALSRVHMHSAAAALALGARTMAEAGRADEAARYGAMARAIYARALKPDTMAGAFERDRVNDFYRDETEADQRALAAAELHALSGESGYLADARAAAPPPATEVSWAGWNWLANAALASRDPAAGARLRTETDGYVRAARTTGAPWGLPGGYVWGSLHRWIGAANAAGWTALHDEPSAERVALMHDIVDYSFGRNNWGVSFLFAETLPNTLHHLYSPACELLRAFPTGALSEGPGDRATHESLARYFRIPADDPFRRFNTPAAVFHDNASDFMCQEATIGGQADLVLLLALAARWERPPL